MKISIMEFRDMIAEAVKRTVSEAKKKPKMAASRSEESINAERDRHVRGLPGYQHGGHNDVLDLSEPLGPNSCTKKQGASNMGGWTSEQTELAGDQRVEAIRALVRMIVREEIRVIRGR